VNIARIGVGFEIVIGVGNRGNRVSSLAKVSMQTDLAENLQEFNSIETERNAIYLLTRLANKLGAPRSEKRGAGGALAKWKKVE